MHRLAATIFCLGIAAPTAAQVRTVPSSTYAEDQDAQQLAQEQLHVALNTNQNGRIADSSAGTAGQRVTRGQAAGIRPMARIANRVQNRIENRIDRNYNPNAMSADPFAIAGDQARTAVR